MSADNGFSTDCVRLLRPAGVRWGILEHSVTYCDLAGRLHTAPRGMLYDGSSKPRPLWPLIGDPWGTPYLLAATVHDHGCYVAACFVPGEARNACRALYDALFREMLLRLGASRVVAWGAYVGVRMGALSTRWKTRLTSYPLATGEQWRQATGFWQHG
jgi:hypothetical protein